MTASTLPSIAPTDVHGILARYLLADGYGIVIPPDFDSMLNRSSG